MSPRCEKCKKLWSVYSPLLDMYLRLTADPDLDYASWMVLQQLGGMKDAAWHAYHNHVHREHGVSPVEPGKEGVTELPKRLRELSSTNGRE
jgi:hypothetical protein